MRLGAGSAYGQGVSISFDRAAGFYDATRGLPQKHADELTEMLVAEIGAGRRVLEIGVGTGRIARPLQAAGVDVMGIDLSPAMLQRLADNAGGRAPFPVLVADATRLPFADASYDVVVASHVFHLIPDWRHAADEVLRVLRPDGRLLVDFGGGAEMPWRGVLDEVMRTHGIERIRPGANQPDELADYYADRAAKRPLPVLTVPFQRSIAEDVRDTEKQIFSWSWPYTAEQMKAAADELRARAERAGFVIDAPEPGDYRLQWWAFDVQAGNGP